jgi:hypothetical protein
MMGLISSIFVAHIIVKVMDGLDGTTQRKLEEEKKANQTYPGTPIKRTPEQLEDWYNSVYESPERRLEMVERCIKGSGKGHLSEAYVTNLRNQVNQSKKSD